MVVTMDKLFEIASAIASRGGRPFLVGGAVRDEIMGLPSKDLDIEAFDIDMSSLKAVLSEFGNVKEVGEQFGVLHIEELDLDVSLPRRDNKTGTGHTGFFIEVDQFLSVAEAAKRRDLTINSISVDLITGEIIDPCGGMEDIQSRVLRATDHATFGEDPLRALRVMQFAARFDFDVDSETMGLVAAQPIYELPRERIWAEFEKLMLKGKTPSRGLEVLRRSGLLFEFPELHYLRDVPQDPEYHPEGDVYTHTCMVIDEAAKLRIGAPVYDLPLMFAALCHDLGKITTTQVEDDGRVHAYDHEGAGVWYTNGLMTRLGAPYKLIDQVEVLVANHLRPVILAGEAGSGAYRRLGRKLDSVDVSFDLLADVSRADALGRAREVDLSRQDLFLEEANKYVVDCTPSGRVEDTVMGRHLIERGWKQGPEIGAFLAITRRLEDDLGLTDVGELIRLAELERNK